MTFPDCQQALVRVRAPRLDPARAAQKGACQCFRLGSQRLAMSLKLGTSSNDIIAS